MSNTRARANTAHHDQGAPDVIETVAVVLFVVTAVTWVWIARPQLVAAWASLAHDLELDPSLATQHAALFAPVPPPS